MKKVITAFVQLKEGMVDRFMEIASPVIEGSNAEEGCISYQLFQDPFNKNRFSIIEEWKGQAAIDFHFSTPHFKAFAEALNPLVAAPLRIVIYDIAAEQLA